MLLRDERLIALDCAIVAAKKAADAYEDAAMIAQDDGMTELFTRLSQRRDAMAAEIEPFLLALGELPSDPDVEGQAVGTAWRHIKAALSPDERPHLLAEAAALEAQLSDCIDAALAVDVAADVRAVLERLRDELAGDADRIAAGG